MARLGNWAFVGLSLLVALLSLRVFFLPFNLAMPGMAHFVIEAPWRLWGHILGGPLALALATVQLSGRLRARWPGLHRWSGRLYGVAVLAAGMAGLTLAPTSISSEFARAGFMALAVVWMGATARGISLAIQGDLARHRWWMERSIALTFSAVTLRLIMLPLVMAGWTPSETYDVTAWGAWMLNLVMLDLWQRGMFKRITAPEGAV